MMTKTQWARHVFLWLYQVNADGELQPVCIKCAVQLTRFLSRTQGGLAYPGYRKIGDPIGISIRAVGRAMERLDDRGHLRVEWGKPGRGTPNRYWIVVKDSGAGAILDAEDSGAATPLSDDQDSGAGGSYSGAGDSYSGADATEPCKNHGGTHKKDIAA